MKYSPFLIPGRVFDTDVVLCLDTGSACTVVDHSVCESLNLRISPWKGRLHDASGNNMQVLGYTELEVVLPECKAMRLLAVVVRSLTRPILIGQPDLCKYGLVLDCREGRVRQRVSVGEMLPANSEGEQSVRVLEGGELLVTSVETEDVLEIPLEGASVVSVSAESRPVVMLDPPVYCSGVLPSSSDSPSLLFDCSSSCPGHPFPEHVDDLISFPRDSTSRKESVISVDEMLSMSEDEKKRGAVACLGPLTPESPVEGDIRTSWSAEREACSSLFSGVGVNEPSDSSPSEGLLSGNEDPSRMLCSQDSRFFESVLSVRGVYPNAKAVFVNKSMVIPAFQEAMVPVRIPSGRKVGVIFPEMDEEGDFLAACVLVRADDHPCITVFNPNGYQVVLCNGRQLGMFVESCFAEELVREVNGVDGGEEFGAMSEEESRDEFLASFSLGDCALKGRYLEQLKEILWNCKEVFPRDKWDIGSFRNSNHVIERIDEQPVSKPNYRMSPVQKKLMDDHIALLLKHGMIEKTVSPYNSPFLLVQKPDGSMRCVQDLRQINEKIRAEGTVLPRVDETLDELGGMKFFAVTDCNSGFFQVKLHESCRDMFAFSDSKHQQYRWVRLAMGCKNSSAVFQRHLSSVIRGARNSWAYIDDLLTAGEDEKSFLANFEEVLTRLQKEGVTLRRDKCKIGLKQIRFLGHLVSAEGVRPDPGKVSAIMDVRAPQNAKEVSGFLACCGFYRRFICDFSTIAEPLNALTRKGIRFRWGPREQEAFQTLKDILASEPVLCHPDFSKEFKIETDSSEYGLSGILLQKDDDEQDRVVAYMSASLNRSQRNYATWEKELFAIVSAVNKFRPYVFGTRFEIVTDNRALLAAKKMMNPCGRVMRWLSDLAQYDYYVTYRRGRDNVVPDALSRFPFADGAPEPLERPESVAMIGSPDDSIERGAVGSGRDERGVLGVVLGDILSDLNEVHLECQAVKLQSSFTEEELVKAQISDPILGQVHLWFMGASLEKFCLGDPLFTYACAYKHGFLSRKSGALFYKDRLCIPASLVPWILNSLHCSPFSGHFGIFKTLSRVSSRMFWPDMENDVVNFVKSCESCSVRKPVTRPVCAPLGRFEETEPLGFLHIDFFGSSSACFREWEF